MSNTTNNNFNHSMITGNLTKDPVITERTVAATGEIMKVANFTVANNFTRRNGEKAVAYYKVALWGEDAERAAGLKKGNLVKVRGTLTTDTWTGRDGQVRVDQAFHGRTLVDVWNRDTKAWAQVTMKAEAQPAVKAEAPSGINAETLPFAG